MNVRGIRGAITVSRNSKKDILQATKLLLKRIVEVNRIKVEDIAAAIFSVTDDLNAEFPAVAARELKWFPTPLLCTYEIAVPGSLKKCIRVLILLNTKRKQKEIVNVYLGDAKKLKPMGGGFK